MGRSRDLASLPAAGAVGTTNLADNAVTTAKIAPNAVVTADIADGNVTGAKLENSGVTAGAYGSASAIPVVTVDAKGRVTAASTVPVTAGVTSVNGQTGAVTVASGVPSSYGDIGTVAQLASTWSTAVAPGGTVSGSYLFYNNNNALVGQGLRIDIVNSNFDPRNRTTAFSMAGFSFTPIGSGTWRHCGFAKNIPAQYNNDGYGGLSGFITTSLWQRIA